MATFHLGPDHMTRYSLLILILCLMVSALLNGLGTIVETIPIALCAIVETIAWPVLG